MRTIYKRLAVSRRVLVQLKTGDAVSGILWDERRSIIVLRDATVFDKAGGSQAAMEGEVLIDRQNIAYVQCPQLMDG